MNIQSLKKILKRIFFLPPVPTLLICIPAYGLVVYALAGENVNPKIAYISYILSAYALIISITGITGVMRFVRQGIKHLPFVKKMLGIPLVDRYFREDTFRAEAALYQVFFINLLYAGIKMVSGIMYKSVWYTTLAIYYILLAVMRFSLLDHVRSEGTADKNKASGWRRYRLCGIILLFMNFALSGIVTLVVRQNSGFVYPGVFIYIMAMYAFYAAITAVWNVIKFRKFGSPILSAAKVINLTAALVSMLSLETAMLTQFGAADDADFRQTMAACTGAGIAMIVLGMAMFMIVKSTKQLKSISLEVKHPNTY